MKLHRDLDITQKTAWHLVHRIRKSWETELEEFTGPVEVSETYIDGKEKNKHEHKKLHVGRGTVGKTAVVGAKDRTTKQVQVQVVSDTTADPLTGFVYSTSRKFTPMDSRAYQALKRAAHATVKHSVKQYVNGMESFWSLLKRSHYGTYHKMSRKHLQRYVDESVGRLNQRRLDTADQVEQMAKGLV